jgi:putative hydrolase
LNNKPLFYKFSELTETRLNTEYQIHTDQTDGKASIEELFYSAVNQNLTSMAFTEHVRRDTLWFKDFYHSVKKHSLSYPQINAYVGCESKVLNFTGELDINDEILDHSEIILGSVHRFPSNLFNGVNMRELPEDEFAQIEYELSLAMIKNAPIDVLAHPGGMYSKIFNKPFPSKYMSELMNATIKRNIAIEINTSYLTDVDGFLQLCEEINPKISIGSDVHQINEMGVCRDVLLSKINFKGETQCL